MGLFDKVAEIAAKKYIAGKVSDIKMGKLGAPIKTVWQFLDGWKSWLVAVVAVYKLVCVNCASAGYLDSGLGAIGWDRVSGAFDPQEAAMAIGVVVALGHRFVKAVQQYRAGVPATEVLSEKKPA